MDTPNPQSSVPVNGTVIPKFDPKDVSENKVFAALSYVGVLCFIPLLMKKDSKFAQEHAKQGLILFIAEVIVGILGGIPFFGWAIIGPIGSLVALIVSVVGLVKAINGEFWEIPVIGQYRSKINL